MEILLNSKHPLHCYKHNGKIHRTWDEITILDETDDYLVCGNNKVKITESDGRTHKTKETAIIFLYKDRWFHVTAQFKNTGLYKIIIYYKRREKWKILDYKKLLWKKSIMI